MTTQIPNSMLMSPLGVTGVLRIAATPSIPLDTAGNGKAMPLVFGTRIAVTTPLVLIAPPFSSMVDGGVCTGSYRVTAAVDDSAFTRSGLPMDIGFDCDVAFVAGNPPRIIVQRGAAVDTIAPVLGVPAVADAARGFIDTPIVELNFPALNGVLAGVTLIGFAGKTATAVATIGNVLRVTLSAPAVSSDTGTIAFAAGMVRDASNNLSVAMATTAVMNNIIAIPNAPVLTAGTNTSTIVSGTIAASTGAAPVSYTLFYKTAAAGTYTTGATISYTNAATPFSIPGLVASTSYNVKAQANNTSGASIDSNVITSSTTALATFVIEDLFNNRVIPAAGGTINTVGARSDGGAWTVTGGAIWDVNNAIAGNAITTGGINGQIHASVGHADTVVEVMAIVKGYPWIGVRSPNPTAVSQVTVLFSPTSTEIRNSAGTVIGSDPTANPATVQTYSADVTGSTIVAKVNGVIRVTATLTLSADLTGTYVSWNTSPVSSPDQISRFRAT